MLLLTKCFGLFVFLCCVLTFGVDCSKDRKRTEAKKGRTYGRSRTGICWIFFNRPTFSINPSSSVNPSHDVLRALGGETLLSLISSHGSQTSNIKAVRLCIGHILASRSVVKGTCAGNALGGIRIKKDS